MKAVSILRSSRIALSLLAGASSLALIQPAHAQTATPPPSDAISEIVVTGTSIRGVAPVGSQIQTLDQTSISQTGATSVTDILRSLPQVFNLGADESHVTGGGVQTAGLNVTYGSAVNLRGIGPEATLTLLDGRRLVPQGLSGQFIDPSFTPAIALQRVEVVPDGASAVYGSDAVSGVVNMVLRKPTNGIELWAKGGAGDHINEEDVSALGGKTWGSRSGVMVAVEYDNRSDLPASARSGFYTDNLTSIGGPDNRLITGDVQSGTKYIAIPSNQNGVGLTAASFNASAPINRSSRYTGVDILPAQKHISTITHLDQEITENLKFFVEGYYSRRTFTELAPSTTSNLTVPKQNPYYVNPFSATATSVVVNYNFFSDTGPNLWTGNQDVEQVFTGFEGNWRGWHNSTFFTTGNDEEFTARAGVNINAANTALASTSTATALNVFGSGGNNSAAVIAPLLGHGYLASRFDQEGGESRFDGSVFKLPGGDFKLAFGVAYYQQRARGLQYNNTSSANTSITLLTVNTDDKRTITSVYAEGYLPIVGPNNQLPLVKSLNLSLAGRYDDYSIFGGTTNPKFGVTWELTDDFQFNASYGHSFHAPALGDVDANSSRQVNVVSLADPTSPTGQSTVLRVTGGNANLTPETAVTWSAGGQYHPAWLPGLRVTTDYFNIQYNNRIGTPASVLTVLQQASIYAPFITRNPTTAQITALINDPTFTGNRAENPSDFVAIIDARRQNTGSVQISGLDFSANYGFPFVRGTAQVGISGEYMINFYQAVTSLAPLLQDVNTLNYPQSVHLRGNVGWGTGPFNSSVFVNYTGSYTNNAVTPYQTVSPYTTVDLALSYDLGKISFSKDLAIYLNVTDLFNQKPPAVINGNFAYDQQVANVIGRFGSIQLKAKF